MKMRAEKILCIFLIFFLYSCSSGLREKQQKISDQIPEKQTFLTKEVFKGKVAIGKGVWGITYWKDTKYVYLIRSDRKLWNKHTKFFQWKLVDADLTTFKILAVLPDCLWGIDSKNVYFFEHKLIDADVDSFNVIDTYGEGYAKDNHSVFFRHVKIPGADPHTFTIMRHGEGEVSFSRDKNHTYAVTRKFGIRIIKDIDFKTFQELDSGYSKDKNHVFYNELMIVNADPETFEIVCTADGLVTEFARDRNHVYWKGKVLKGINPKSFDPNEYSRKMKKN